MFLQWFLYVRQTVHRLDSMESACPLNFYSNSSIVEFLESEKKLGRTRLALSKYFLPSVTFENITLCNSQGSIIWRKVSMGFQLQYIRYVTWVKRISRNFRDANANL